MTMKIACCYEYSHRQRIAFYMVGLGLALCIVGCASPFWLSGKIIEDESTSHLTHKLVRVDSLEGETNTFDVDVGLWWYCIGLEGREQMCFDYPPAEYYKSEHKKGTLRDDSPTYVMLVRTLMCGCLLVALAGLLVVCFYCTTCCSNGHTLGYGLVFFLAGLLGFAAVLILTLKVDVLLSLPQSSTSFGWAFPVFLTGNNLIVIASGVLCIPPRKNSPTYEMVFTVNNPQNTLIGQMGVFEALPDPASLAIQKTDI